MSVYEERGEREAVLTQTTPSSGASCVSVKSVESLIHPPNIREGEPNFDSRLSRCKLTEEGCSYLASALSVNPSHLRELDLSHNHLRDSGVKLFSALLEDPSCKLEIKSLDQHGLFKMTEAPQKYACDLTLDPNTLNTGLDLSEGNKMVKTYSKEIQSYTGEPERPGHYPDHPERFDLCRQVLCKESLNGRCYWEAEWSGNTVHISVTYKGICRKGLNSETFFGLNEYSWSLNYFDGKFTFFHNTESKEISAPFYPPKRVGVYVDCPGGTLSFYSISDKHTLTHLHTHHTTFTEPLYAGFGIYSGLFSLSQPGQSRLEQTRQLRNELTGEQFKLSASLNKYKRKK